jgi:hypothetical protein
MSTAWNVAQRSSASGQTICDFGLAAGALIVGEGAAPRSPLKCRTSEQADGRGVWQK